jgi:hypothetical protein
MWYVGVRFTASPFHSSTTMRFITITIFAVTASLVALAIANPVPNRMAGGGIAIPLVRHESPFLTSNKTIDLDTITSHGISVREYVE